MVARPSFLPPQLRGALGEVGRQLARGGRMGVELDRALGLLANLGPGQVARADAEIAEASGLSHHALSSYADKLLSMRASHAEQLLRTPGLEHLFLFHRDGRLREAALRKITGGLPSPFLFAAVLWRLNDWAAPVREAAVLCATRSFPLTDPAVVARTATELLVRQASWGRWRSERELLDRAFARDDVAAQLAELIVGGRTGPQASTLRYALRAPALDRHLDRIARKAAQPSVRAAVLDALINRQAEWPSGTDWQWIDKSMGVRRKVTVFSHRPLTVTPERDALIALGAADHSAVVRRVALTGVIRHLSGTADGRAFAEPLLADRSPSVRERAEFILHPRTA